jgi:hypothetical protein
LGPGINSSGEEANTLFYLFELKKAAMDTEANAGIWEMEAWPMAITINVAGHEAKGTIYIYFHTF